MCAAKAGRGGSDDTMTKAHRPLPPTISVSSSTTSLPDFRTYIIAYANEKIKRKNSGGQMRPSERVNVAEN